MLLTGACLTLTQPAFSQSMTNTDQVITLTNTCMQAGLSSGTYNLELSYYDLDQNFTKTVPFSNVSVVVSGNVMTITAPPGSFPSVDVNGWWSLPDAYPGQITLSQGTSSTLMFWFLNDNGTTGFNCIALPIIFGSFSSFPWGSNAIMLNWSTEQEDNSTFIEIWRSPTDSAHSFYKVGQVPAAGNSHSQVFYHYMDSNLDTRNYYYLKALSSDGSGPFYSDTISWRCDACHYTPPAQVNCPDSIIGPDQICALETPISYHLSDTIPNYSTIVWNVDNPASAKVKYTNDPTQVNLLRTNVPGMVTLSATMSGCTNVITRTVRVGPPDPLIEELDLCPSRIILLDTTYADANTWTWKVRNDSTGVTTISHAPSVNILVNRHLNTWTVTHTYTSDCGTSDSVVMVVGCGGASGFAAGSLSAESVTLVKLSPNPSNGLVGVSLEDGTVRHKMYQVRVVDGQGVARKMVVYPGVESASLDLSGLTSGIYTVQVFDNKTWRSSQVVLTK